MSTLQERFALAMAPPCAVTAADLSRACKVKPPSVHEWLNGPTKTLRGPNAVCAARELGVNVDWLSTGRGPMRLAGDKDAAPAAPAHPLFTKERRASDDVIALQLAMKALVTTTLNRLPGTAEPFSDLLRFASEGVDFSDDAGLVASLFGIAQEARDAEEVVTQALQRARSGARTKPKK